MKLPIAILVAASVAAFTIVRSEAGPSSPQEPREERKAAAQSADSPPPAKQEAAGACASPSCSGGHPVGAVRKPQVQEVTNKVSTRWRLQSGGELPEPDEASIRLQIEQGRIAAERRVAELEARGARSAAAGSRERMEWLRSRVTQEQLDAQLGALDRGHFLLGPDRQVCDAYGYCVRNFRHLTFVLMAETGAGRCILVLPDDPSSDHGKALDEYAKELARAAGATVAPQTASSR